MWNILKIPEALVLSQLLIIVCILLKYLFAPFFVSNSGNHPGEGRRRRVNSYLLSRTRRTFIILASYPWCTYPTRLTDFILITSFHLTSFSLRCDVLLVLSVHCVCRFVSHSPRLIAALRLNSL